MRRKLIIAVVFAFLFSAAVQTALADLGNIVITPPFPLTQESPATFQISVSQPADPTIDPQILLAMTVSCYNGLDTPTVAVHVTWTGGSVDFVKTDFLLLTGDPPPKVPDGSDYQYTRSALSSHLGEDGSTDVYWAMKPFLSGPITATAQTFVVTLHSTDPRMLVYALGKTGDTDTYNIWVPPTNPGFVIPEPATVAAVATSIGALGLYAYRRKRKP